MASIECGTIVAEDCAPISAHFLARWRFSCPLALAHEYQANGLLIHKVRVEATAQYCTTFGISTKVVYLDHHACHYEQETPRVVTYFPLAFFN